MTNRMDRFTNDARIVLKQSQLVAQTLDYNVIEVEHLLVAMTQAAETQAHDVLDNFDVIESKLLPFLNDLLKERGSLLSEDSLSLSNSVKKVLELAVDEARRRGHRQINSLHLLTGIIRLDSARIQQIFTHFEVDSNEIRKYTNTKLLDTID